VCLDDVPLRQIQNQWQRLQLHRSRGYGRRGSAETSYAKEQAQREKSHPN
jgi:hypothetical protein